MININGKLLDKLDANQFYLLSILLNYGKKSRPSNAVLRFKTGWAMQKLQKIKRELVEVGVLKINAKSEKKNGANGSNEYLIKTKLASKYNGSPIRENHVIEIQLTEKQIHEIQLTEKHVSDFHGDLKVLKLSVIEKVKLLKEESDQKALSHIKELELEIEQLKTELKNKEKSPPKKESGQHEFPNVTAKKTYVLKSPKQELENGQKKPYEIFLSSYPFEKKGWSEKLKQIFLTYCEVKNEKSYRGYATAQIKLRLAEINEAIPKHEINWIEEIVTSGANGAWADFKFDDRIKNRKDKAKKDKPNSKNDDGTPSYMMGLQ